MGEQPRLTSREPWDIIAQTIAQMQQTANIDQQTANRAQMIPVEQAAALQRIRTAEELGLEFLPKKLAITEPHEIAREERQEQRSRRIQESGAETTYRYGQKAIDAEIDRYKADPEGYIDRKRPSYSRGATGVPDNYLALPTDEFEQEKMLENLSKEGIEVVRRVPHKGKLYIEIRPIKQPTTTEDKPVDPAATPPGPNDKGGRGAVRAPVSPSAPAAVRSPPDLRNVNPGEPDDATKSITDGIHGKPRYNIDQPVKKTEGGEGSNKMVGGLKGNQPDLINGLYDALTAQGFSDMGAKAMIAEVGRENSINENLIFGSHDDPHNDASNVGFFSWQGSRGRALKNRLREAGLMDRNGRIAKTQESLEVMAEFAAEEMATTNNGLYNYLKSDDVDPEKAASVLGRRYIKWRYNDPKYKKHHEFRRDWGDKASAVIDQRASAEPSQIKPTDDPDVFDVLFA